MPLRLRFGRRRRKDEGNLDELVGARLLLLAGRSPAEQYDLLQQTGCLSSLGQGDRMAVIRLLNRLHEAHVARGYHPPRPEVTHGEELAEHWRLLASAPAIGGRSDQRQLVRLQADALRNAGLLDVEACRLPADDAEAWWTGRLPQVTAVHEEHNRILEAIAPRGKLKPGQRTDPITCPLCGRPAPRGATYCVWCGRWLAAPAS